MMDGWSVPDSKRRSELQNVHLLSPEVKCRWSAKHCWKNRPMVSPSQGWLSALFLLLWRPEWYKAPGLFVQKYSFCKRFCSSKWEAEGHFAKAHGVPSKRKICLKLCLGTGFIGVLWIVEYYRLLLKTCGAELSAGSRFWYRQGAS